MSGHVHLRLWLLTACLSAPLQAQFHVLGASQPVVVRVGDDVTLPCRCNPSLDLAPQTVEWSRTELKPDPSDPLKKVEYVHVYTNWREELDMKLLEFSNRTLLFTEQFGAGNASLLIQNVRLTDNGTYKCLIPDPRIQPGLREGYVSLIVLPVEAVTLVTPDPGVQEDQPSSASIRSVLAAIVSFTIFLILSASIVIFIIAKKFTCTKPQERSGEVVPRGSAQSESEDEGDALFMTVEEKQVLSPSDGTQRMEIQAG